MWVSHCMGAKVRKCGRFASNVERKRSNVERKRSNVILRSLRIA